MSNFEMLESMQLNASTLIPIQDDLERSFYYNFLKLLKLETFEGNLLEVFNF